MINRYLERSNIQMVRDTLASGNIITSMVEESGHLLMDQREKLHFYLTKKMASVFKLILMVRNNGKYV